MLKIETILCPTDLSVASLKAVPIAARMARIHGADLHLLHVHLLHALTPEGEDVPFPGEDRARATLESSAGEVPWNQVVHEIRRGVNAAPTILEYAAEHDADLIVMGSHGRRGVRRLLLGSVTEEVVRLAPCPVLVVRENAEAEAPADIDRVIVPVDFSDETAGAIAYAAELASAFDAPLELVHAVEPIPYVQMSYPVPVDTSGWKDYAERQLERLAGGVHEVRETAATTVVGLADEAVIDAARRAAAPIVVMASHGHGGIARLMLGSTTERILRRAECPVLVVRPSGRPSAPSRHEAHAIHGLA